MLEIEAFRDIPVTESPDKRQIRKDELRDLMHRERLSLAKGERPEVDGGYYLQFGVFMGFTLNILAKERSEVTWHGFDSFEGLPCDWDLGGKFCKADKWKIANPPKVEDNVVLVKGWYKDTIPEFAESMTGNAAFIDVDCDVYESARAVLFGFNEKIRAGTIIRFDELCDWRELGWHKRPGAGSRYTAWRDHEWKALNEWVTECGRVVEPLTRSSHMSGTVLVTK